MGKIAQALSIAGSDSGGGAGIQADLKTFQERGVFGTTAITAITAQNTTGVFDIHPIPLQTIQAQLKAIADDFTISAFKVGMLGSIELIKCVAEDIKKYDFGYFVLDPVMVTKGGIPLLEQSSIKAIKEELIPLCDVITPNLHEAKALTNMDIKDKQSAKEAALKLQEMGAKVVVIKGGDTKSTSEVCDDWVFVSDEEFTLNSPRFKTAQTHGTGCTFSACITAELAKGNSIKDSIILAKEYISAAISNPLNLGSGHGPANHWAYSLSKKMINIKNMLQVYFIAGTQDCLHLGDNKKANLLYILEKSLKNGITCFQFREKGKNCLENKDEIFELAKKAQELCKKYNVPFFINDDIELALKLNATGIHIGQDDRKVEEVIKLIDKKLLLGLSINTLEQGIIAKDIEGIDYFGVGPIYETISKSDAKKALVWI